jgi:CMP-N-acetylneuraminic acid synthetase
MLLGDVGFNKIVLSTNNKEYFCEAEGLDVSLELRNADLSNDFATTSEVLLAWLDRSRISDDTIIFLWQVTSPFRTHKLLTDFIERAKLLKHGEMLMCVSKTSKISEMGLDDLVRPIDYSFGTRSQDVNPILVKENGLGYAITAKTLKIEQTLFPSRVISFPTNSYCLDLDIDEERDYIIAKTLLENGI